MTQTTLNQTKIVNDKYMSIQLNEKNEAGYHKTTIIANKVAAESLIAGKEVGTAFWQMDITSLNQKIQSGELKLKNGRYVQLKIFDNSKKDAQLAEARAMIAQLKSENAQLKTAHSSASTSDDIPF